MKNRTTSTASSDSERVRLIKMLLVQTYSILNRPLPDTDGKTALFLEGWVQDLLEIPTTDLREMFSRARTRSAYFSSKSVLDCWIEERQSRIEQNRNKNIPISNPPENWRVAGPPERVRVFLSETGQSCTFTVQIFEEQRATRPRRIARFDGGLIDSGGSSVNPPTQPVRMHSPVKAICPVHGPFSAKVLVLGKSVYISGCSGCSMAPGERSNREYHRQSDGKVYMRTFSRFEQNDNGKKTTYVRYSDWEECPF